MVDYHFYTDRFLGERISEKAFPTLAAQAAGVLESYERRYQLSGGEESRAMAICAMAECLYDHNRHRHESASVGSVSVRYQVPKTSLERRLYQAAGTYLDIYRGVQ